MSKSTTRTALVTGATAGIGLATARALYQRGWHVLLHGRTPEKAAHARDSILALDGTGEITPLAADLSRPEAVDHLAGRVSEAAPRLDVLLNNAGVWNSRRELTEAGIEKTFAVNHLAYFRLTARLLPLLGASGRVICVASDSHKQVGGMNFADIGLAGNYHGLRSYAQSKLANVLFVYEYERRRDASRHPSIYAVQPGLVQTDIGLKGNTWLHRLAWRVRRRMWGHKSPAEGAETGIYLATAAEAQTRSGLYWDDCKPKRSFSSSYDPAEARQLWEISESLSGIKFFGS